jgi:hypothetical protein
MTKSVFDTLDCQGLEVIARLAQAYSTEHNFSHHELLVHEMIQWYAARRQVPSGLTGLERNLAFPFERFNCFHFDEGDLPVRTAGLTESTLLTAIAIADKPVAGNCLHLKHLLGIGPFVLANVNRFEPSVKHGASTILFQDSAWFDRSLDIVSGGRSASRSLLFQMVILPGCFRLSSRAYSRAKKLGGADSSA